MGEARPPRKVARISVFHRRCDGSVLLKHHWSRGINGRVCAAWGDSPMVEEFELPLRPAAGRNNWRGTTLATTAQFAGGFFWLLSQVVMVLYFIVCVVCVCCLCCGGVRFGVFYTNASSYMMWLCSCLLFQKKNNQTRRKY